MFFHTQITAESHVWENIYILFFNPKPKYLRCVVKTKILALLLEVTVYEHTYLLPYFLNRAILPVPLLCDTSE